MAWMIRPSAGRVFDGISKRAETPAIKRKCGSCQLCCRLLPVLELNKTAGQACSHQGIGGGCRIYERRPMSCKLWNCRWLMGDGLPKPEQCHYVVDVMMDYVRLRDEDAPEVKVPVIQVWVDPEHRDAHRDPALRKYLNRRAREDGCAALIRWSSGEGALTLIPPALAGDKQWHEISGECEPQHDSRDIAGVLREGGNSWDS